MDPNGGNQDLNYTEATRHGGLGALRDQARQAEPAQEVVSWRASEFIDHQKSSIWFAVLTFGALILSVVVYVVTRDILATLVILVAAIAFGVYAGKKPRTLTYSLGPNSLKIDGKSYNYDDFKSFCLMQEGALYSIILESVKRFMPPLTIYFAAEDGEKIFDTLAMHLPHEIRKRDAIDSLMRRIRF
jgi:hypothetical protein